MHDNQSETMPANFNRRNFIEMGVAAGAAVILFSSIIYRPKSVDYISPNVEPVPLNQEVHDVEGEINLLSGAKWEYMAGVANDAEGLHVQHIGLDLVNQDGTFAQHNNPVNLYGTHLVTDGAFEVSATISNLVGEGTLSLYGRVPLILDEQCLDSHSVHIKVTGKTVKMQARSGDNGSQIEEKNFQFKPEAVNTFTLRRSGGKLAIIINGAVAGSLPENGIFQSGQLWLGMDSSDSMLISKLASKELSGHMKSVDASTLRIQTLDPQGFQELINKKRPGFKMGTAVSLEPLVSTQDYANVLGGGWYGVLTTENALKAQVVQPIEGKFNFTSGDAIVDFAKNNSLAIHGHALVFGEANPRWMQEIAKKNPGKLESVMTNHIKTLVGHYKGKIATWDVVNEPLDGDNLRNHIWYQTMGEGYIEKAFRTAHAADPNAQLFINEYGLEGAVSDVDTEKWDNFLKLIDRQLLLGVPIHGVGFQAHVDSTDDYIDTAVLRTRFRQLAQRGLLVRISEMDVINDDPVRQANQFAEVLKVCMEENNCVSFSTWGIGEGNGATAWIENGKLMSEPNLPFDKKMHPRKPVRSMQAILR